MKPSMLPETRPQHLVIFGDPKTGKSTLAAKLLLDGYRLTWISLDGGHECLFKFGISAEQLDEQVNLILVPDTKEKPVAIATCLKIMTGALVNICDIHGVVECTACKIKKDAVSWSQVHCNSFGPKDIIVFDHLGQLSASAMSAAFAKYKKPLDEKPEWDQYATQGFALDQFFFAVQNATFNVICITHVLEVQMENDDIKLVPMAGTTNYSRNVGKYFDHMIYCHMSSAMHKFGSMTSYAPKLVMGSRSDIAIEKQERGKETLLPFFNGSIRPRNIDTPEDAAKLISKASEKVSGIPGGEKVQPVEIEGVVEKEVKIEQIAGTPQVTLVAKVTNPPPITPSVLTPTAAGPTALDRMNMLAKLKSMKG